MPAGMASLPVEKLFRHLKVKYIFSSLLHSIWWVGAINLTISAFQTFSFFSGVTGGNMSCLLFTFTKPNIILGHNVISIAKKECSHKGACIPAFVPSCFHHHEDYISAEKNFFPLPPIPLCHESGDLLCVYHLVHSLGEFLAPPLLKII